VITLILDGYKLVSPNRTRGQHWAAAKKRRDEAEWAVRIAMRAATTPGYPYTPATTPRIVTITRYAPRQMDPDNLVAACKPLIDSLVSHNLLVDDSPRWLTSLTVLQVKAKQPSVTITIREPGAGGEFHVYTAEELGLDELHPPPWRTSRDGLTTSAAVVWRQEAS
jgi:Holliday junction resolvase RusA-like endonuclease